MNPRTLAGWLSHIEGLSEHPIELGLERVASVRSALALDPQAPILTVAGTNGKGSTCAMLESILRCAGYRVGLYTSPHLLHYNERVRVNGEAVSDARLCAAFAQVEAARGSVPLTYFEFGTLAAMLIFIDSAVEAIVLEVGLGGRLDAVNVFDSACAVVTTVDLDHQDYLGSTREAIGFEKAGIFRPGRPAIVGEAEPPSSLLEQAHRLGADLQVMARDFGYQSGRGQWSFWSRRGRRGGLAYPALRGAIQLANASTAIAALESLAECLPVSAQDIRRGLIEVDLIGRFQALPGMPTFVLDVCHNPQAAGVLADNLDQMLVHPRTWAVFGMLDDKDATAVVERLKSRIDRWIVTSLPGPRGRTAQALGDILAAHAIGVEACADSPADACRLATERAGDNDRIVIFGSFLTVAGALPVVDDERKRRSA